MVEYSQAETPFGSSPPTERRFCDFGGPPAIAPVPPITRWFLTHLPHRRGGTYKPVRRGHAGQGVHRAHVVDIMPAGLA